MVLHAHRTDNELLRKVKVGNKDCFEVLVRRHTQALYRIGRMFGFDPQDVEDLISDAHFAAYLRIADHNGAMAYRTWLTGIMMEKCQQKAQLSSRLNTTAGAAEPASGPQRVPCGAYTRLDESTVSENPISADVDQLPASLKSVFVLREVEGFSETETAELLRISTDSVRHKMESAKSSLSRPLRKRFFHPDIYPFHLSTCDRVVARVLGRI